MPAGPTERLHIVISLFFFLFFSFFNVILLHMRTIKKHTQSNINNKKKDAFWLN